MVRLLHISIFFLTLRICKSSDTIAVNQNLTDGETIVSGNAEFELGFFSLTGSENRYLGIWFRNSPQQTLIWIANPETPLTDNSGAVMLDSQGNLALVNRSGVVIWSSNSSASGPNIIAQLLDTGNLVIKNGKDHQTEEGDIYKWQSFDYLGDTLILEMKLGKNFITGRETYLTSWKSVDDPSPGEYTLRFLMVKGKYQQLYISKGSTIESRVGPYNGITFSGPFSDYNARIYMAVNPNEMYLGSISNGSSNLKAILTPGGKVEISGLKLPERKWIQSLSLPVDYCDNYGVCGPFGSCNTATTPYCGCLKGFQLMYPGNNDTSVCERVMSLDCGSGEGFQKFLSMKLPDTQNAIYSNNTSLQDCAMACKKNCSCTAYANPNITPGSVGCLLWFGDLVDVRVYAQNGQDLYVRLAASEFRFHKKKRLVMVASLLSLLIFLGILLALYIRKKRSNTEKQDRSNDEIGNVEVPLISLSKILRATNNFSVDNKLGEGGFGPVYKGVFEEGQEIGVKRLSKLSRQGHHEFKNEVICIAKLQHRNLVKLLGYCMQGDEKMLIYEYMPNKSLDSFLFDETRKLLLDWPQRFHIIHGIARGLLYLHQDSRLKVVHRDLKAANILLDHQMHPKISDFGLARMFKEDESEANTNRVVGTLGYISPEYATKGPFSAKSDVFSFGVLVLEIVSGKKNRGFVHEAHDDYLLGHAWRLYKQEKSLDLIDECLHTSYYVDEVLRSVHIGLLCVQCRVEDRPSMQKVVAFLGGEGSLPFPKKPAFFIQESENNSTPVLPVLSSVNGVTLSQLDGR